MFNANSVDPDQTPQNAASDLVLHCLPMSLLWDARLKLVNLYHSMGLFRQIDDIFFLFSPENRF